MRLRAAATAPSRSPCTGRAEGHADLRVRDQICPILEIDHAIRCDIFGQWDGTDPLQQSILGAEQLNANVVEVMRARSLMSSAEPTASNKPLSDDSSNANNDGRLRAKDAFKVRSYQLEMLEESMERNIIVAVSGNLPRRFCHWFE